MEGVLELLQRLCSLVGLARFGDQASHLIRFYKGVDLDCFHIDGLEKSWLGLADSKVLLYICRQASLTGVQTGATVGTAHAR